MHGWLLAEWVDGWMDEGMNGWMVREMKGLEVRRDIKRWMNTEQLPLHFLSSLPLLSLFSPSWLPSRSVPAMLALSFSLSFSLSLSYSDQMSNSCGATAWLINALEEPREVEHNKQTGEGGRKKKSERRDWREKNERVRSVRVCVNVCVHRCVSMR